MKIKQIRLYESKFSKKTYTLHQHIVLLALREYRGGIGYERFCKELPDYGFCEILGSFHNKKGYKYKKYKMAIEFIRENGYVKFIKIADNWKNAYGKIQD